MSYLSLRKNGLFRTTAKKFAKSSRKEVFIKGDFFLLVAIVVGNQMAIDLRCNVREGRTLAKIGA